MRVFFWKECQLNSYTLRYLCRCKLLLFFFVVYETAKDSVLASDTCAERAIKSTGYVLNHRLPLKARLSKAAACTFFSVRL